LRQPITAATVPVNDALATDASTLILITSPATDPESSPALQATNISRSSWSSVHAAKEEKRRETVETLLPAFGGGNDQWRPVPTHTWGKGPPPLRPAASEQDQTEAERETVRARAWGATSPKPPAFWRLAAVVSPYPQPHQTLFSTSDQIDSQPAGTENFFFRAHPITPQRPQLRSKIVATRPSQRADARCGVDTKAPIRAGAPRKGGMLSYVVGGHDGAATLEAAALAAAAVVATAAAARALAGPAPAAPRCAAGEKDPDEPCAA
jgi:hypothetical protein